MERLIIAVIIIAAVLFLFNRTSATGGGSQVPGPTNPTSALPPGYRSPTSS